MPEIADRLETRLRMSHQECLDRIRQLEDALLQYMKRYGPTPEARGLFGERREPARDRLQQGPDTEPKKMAPVTTPRLKSSNDSDITG